jgi:protein ImuB
MSRIVSVWLPAWSIERMRRGTPGSVPEAEPFALVDRNRNGLRIAAANGKALSAGVALGTPLPDARAAMPALAVRASEPERDGTALQKLALWLGRYGPSTNIDATDGAWVDVTGVAHLFGGEAGLCRDLTERLGRAGITARIGLAGTFGTAHALARFAGSPSGSGWTIAPPSTEREALAGLPVAALRLDREAVQLLVRLGLKRCGQLYGLPRSALAARFREATRAADRKAAEIRAATLLLRLDQALGTVAEPRRPLRAPPEASARLAFPDPLLTAEGVTAALERLVALLAAQLSDMSLGARSFRLALYRVDGTVAGTSVGTSTACRDPAHVLRLMRERLAGLDAGFGIDVATLEAERLERLEACQSSLSTGTNDASIAIGTLVDRLVGRLGRGQVAVCEPAESHIPERSEVWRLAMEAPLPGVSARVPPPTHPPRPPLLLVPPEPITVIAEVPEGAPQHVVWRRVARRIVRMEGPERIAPEWWRHVGASGMQPGTRDYYRLEDTTGARYWVFREGLYEDRPDDQPEEDDGGGDDTPPRWFMHGLFP